MSFTDTHPSTAILSISMPSVVLLRTYLVDSLITGCYFQHYTPTLDGRHNLDTPPTRARCLSRSISNPNLRLARQQISNRWPPSHLMSKSSWLDGGEVIAHRHYGGLAACKEGP